MLWEISYSDNKTVACADDWAQPLSKRSRCHKGFHPLLSVGCILPAQSSNRFTAKYLQHLMSAEAGITHPVASYANALPSPGERGEESEWRAAEMPVLVCHASPKQRPAAGLARGRVPQQMIFLQIRALTYQGTGGCRVPESGAASLHLHHHHSTSSRCWVEITAAAARRCTETSAKPRESSWLQSLGRTVRRRSRKRTDLLPAQLGHASPDTTHGVALTALRDLLMGTQANSEPELGGRFLQAEMQFLLVWLRAERE